MGRKLRLGYCPTNEEEREKQPDWSVWWFLFPWWPTTRAVALIASEGGFNEQLGRVYSIYGIITTHLATHVTILKIKYTVM